jgi:hypothetical protein
MRTIKKQAAPLLLIFITIAFQSCNWWINLFPVNPKIEQHGYITDTLGTGINKVKITVLESDDYDGYGEETDMVFYTDENGYYEIKMDNSEYIYYMKMTHDEYIYPIPQPQLGWPQIATYIEEEDINHEMVKRGKVKIEGDVRYLRPDLTYYWMPEVKISVLKREIGNTNYPDTTGEVSYTNENGLFYIEFEGDENYEFFLKPQKEGYYYSNLYHEGTILEDCASCKNIDPGYVIEFGFKMLKEE